MKYTLKLIANGISDPSDRIFVYPCKIHPFYGEDSGSYLQFTYSPRLGDALLYDTAEEVLNLYHETQATVFKNPNITLLGAMRLTSKRIFTARLKN